MNLSSINLVNSISESLECKVDFDPFTNAVSLWPCLHTMDEDAASLRHGPIKDKVCTTATPCMYGCKTVVSYAKNPLISKLTVEVNKLKTMLEDYAKKKLQIDDRVIKRVNRISDLLKFNEGRTPFINAVSFWPCLCTMGEGEASEAMESHRKLADEMCSEIGIKCLFCKIPVVSYGKNHLICNLSDEFTQLRTMILEEYSQPKNVVNDAVELEIEEPKPVIPEVKNYEALNPPLEHVHRRRKSKMRDDDLQDYQIVHATNYDRDWHLGLLACVGGCFGWNPRPGIE